MVEQVIPLTTLSETQRRQALERFAVLRPALEEQAMCSVDSVLLSEEAESATLVRI